MGPNKDQFKTTLKTLRERLLSASRRTKQNMIQSAAGSSQVTKVTFWLSENSFLKKSISAVKKTYASVLIQSSNAVLRKGFVSRMYTNREHIHGFFSNTYSRCVIRGEYTRYDLIVLFVVAFFLGTALKTIAIQNVTIGFEDYTLAPKETLYDINLLQQKIIDRSEPSLNNNAIKGGTCSELN